MIAKPSTAHDIDRYYRGTFVKFRETGDRLYYISGVNKDAITGKDEEGQDFILSLEEEAPYILDYLLPTRAVFQFKSRVAMLQRIPARQYKRGLCEENTCIIYADTSDDYVPLTFNTLKVFVNKPSYRSLKDALFSKTKDKQVAITPRMWFNRLSQNLCLGNKPIAYYERESNKLRVNALFKDEIQTLINANPFPCEVVNV